MSRLAKAKPGSAWSGRWRRAALFAVLWIAFGQTGSAFAQGRADVGKSTTASPPPCHVLNMIEWDLSEALKKCGDAASLFRSELFHSRQMGNLFTAGTRSDGLLTLFGQGRFGTKFSLNVDEPYLTQDKNVDRAFARTKQPVLGGTVRGGLIEDNTDDLGQPTVKGGKVAWSATPSTPGIDDRVSGVIGILTINESEVSLSLSLAPTEAGKGLAMTVKLAGESGAEFGIPRTRRTGERSGEPLDMVGRNPTDGEFLFVPSADTQAVKNIVSALLRSQWIDVPVRPQGGTSYTLTMELARPGHELISRAFENWNLLKETR